MTFFQKYFFLKLDIIITVTLLIMGLVGLHKKNKDAWGLGESFCVLKEAFSVTVDRKNYRS